MNEIAKAHWEKAVAWLDYANNAEDVNTTICYTGMAECALKMAQFAVNNPVLVGGPGEAGYPVPPGSVINAQGIPVPGPNSPAPQGPSQGPKLWGTP